MRRILAASIHPPASSQVCNGYGRTVSLPGVGGAAEAIDAGADAGARGFRVGR